MKTILTVDDQDELRAAIASILISNGYGVQEAPNGSQALQVLKSQYPDLVLLDIDMPGMNGLDVLKRISENELMSEIPVIMLTSLSYRDTVVRSIRSGAVDYVIKPVNAKRLLGKIQRALLLSELQKSRYYNIESKIELSRRGGVTLFTFKGQISIDTATDFQQKLTASLRMQIKNDISILDLRFQPGLNKDQLESLSMIMQALDKPPRILAGRNYTALLSICNAPEEQLFIAEDDIERLLKIQLPE